MIKNFERDPSRGGLSFQTPDAVTGLRVWFCKYHTLGALAELTRLQTLVIAGYPDADFEPLRALRRLRYLSILDFAHVTDLKPLSELSELRTLRLRTLPSWDSSGRTIEVESLEPLAQIPSLEHLELFGIRPPDKSLAALESAPALRTVRVTKYPKPEVARYRDATGMADSFAPRPPVASWT